ncbi:MAG: hypothetical protein GQ527_01060 [Bacteroidales bacterium]|nr:hypothetical protein [Bacteroidales bacterium]
MYIQQSFIKKSADTSEILDQLISLNNNSIDPVKLHGFSWISYSPAIESKLSTYIFREENQELLVVQEGKVKKGKWEVLILSNSILINDGEQELLFNIEYFGNVGMILKKENLDEYLILIKRSKADLQLESIGFVINSFMDDYNKIQKQFDNINLDTTDASLEFEDIAEFHEYRLFPYVATLGTILLIIVVIVIFLSNFWRT